MKLPTSAICVQSFDDSLNSAIRTTYRISLRSSSLREPRYPLLEVVMAIRMRGREAAHNDSRMWGLGVVKAPELALEKSGQNVVRKVGIGYSGNDPSAGSPTETLLRLLLPLNDKVCASSRDLRLANQYRDHSPKSSPDHSIGRSDGRCVQRAGT